MRRVLTQPALVLLLTCSLGAAPGHKISDTAPIAKPVVSKAPIAPKKHPKPYQIGKASWYGRVFHGKSTASGENYNMFGYTAAHRELPLGTWVRVTNLKNNRSVMVRINDRGPVIAGRVIDLSFGAAHLLGLGKHGVGRVRLDIVGPSPEMMELASIRRPTPEALVR